MAPPVFRGMVKAKQHSVNMSRKRHLLEGSRIIFFFGSLELGGAERQGLLLAKYLKLTCHADVQVLAFWKPGKAARICEEVGIHWELLPSPLPGSRLARFFRILKFMLALRGKRPDIILSYTMHPNIACGLIWQYTGAKNFIWNQRDEGIFRMSESLERRVVRHCPLFVANSNKGKAFLVEKLKVSLKKVSVIHNGVELDPPEFSRAEWRQKLEAGNAFLACHVANLSETKEWKTLFKAWGRFLKEWEEKGKRAILLLAGDSFKNQLKLETLSQESGIAHAVSFLGRVDDISGLLKAGDLALFSSRSEGLPNGVLEPMASGLAVVATDIPGIREAVGPAGIPFLFPPGDDRAFSEIILKMAEDPKLRKRAGEANQKRVAGEFAPAKMYSKMIDLLIGKQD